MPDAPNATTRQQHRHVKNLRELFRQLGHDYDTVALDPADSIPRIRVSAASVEGLSDALSRAVEAYGGVIISDDLDTPAACYVEGRDADPDPTTDAPTGIQYRIEREWFDDDVDDVDEETVREVEAKALETEVLLE